jgi:hypothetical protein
MTYRELTQVNIQMFQPGKAPFEVIGEHRRCTAMSKHARRRCRQLTAPGSDKCRFHGGWSLRGKDHPAYEHGDATQAAREMAIWFNTMDRAIGRLNRARTPAEEKKAVEFARHAIKNAPGQG